MKKIIVTFCICLIGLLCQAQDDPVSWSFGAEHIEGSKYKIKFNADIESKWYLYSQNIDEGGPIPTSFFFDDNNEITLVGSVEEKSEAIKNMDEMFGMEVIKFKDKAEFEQIVELKNDVAVISGELEFMTCDGMRCLAPKTIEFNIKIE